jgi:streptogramin lyase
MAPPGIDLTAVRMAHGVGSAAVAAAALLICAAEAQAARLPLGSTITEFVAAPDGSAWVAYSPARGRDRVGRFAPGGTLRSAATGTLLDGQLGLDGHAWFRTRDRRLVRVDPELRRTRTVLPRRLIGPFAIGPDAQLWTPSYDGRMARIDARGAVSYSPAPLPACAGESELHELVRAADGAMWANDFGCDRLLRITPQGTQEIRTRVTSFASLTADASGGVWFARPDGGEVVHVDVAGTLRTVSPALGEVSDIAAAPDGTAWLAHGGCRLSRVDPSGAVTAVAAPLVTHRIAVDASGRPLLAGVTRVSRLTAAPCDDTGPAVRIRRIARDRFRITAGERAALTVDALSFDPTTLESVSHRARRGTRTLRYRVPASRRFPRLRLTVRATDADGNATEIQRTLKR